MSYPSIRISIAAGLIMNLPLLSAATGTEAFEAYKGEIEPILDLYCYDCHGYGTSKGGVTLDEFSPKSIRDHELWVRVLKNTRAHVMPPQDEYQPEPEELAKVLSWIKTSAFGIDPQNIDPGGLTIQRLNRTEYENTIHDLMGVEFNTLDAFPADNSGEGFDNIGELLTLSPMMLEKYFDAATSIVADAVPTHSSVLPEDNLEGSKLVRLFSEPTVEDDQSKDKLQLSFYEPSRRDGKINISKSGQYEVVLNIKPVSFSSFNGFDYNRCRFVVKIDGESRIDREFEFTSGKTYTFSFDYDWEPGEKEVTLEIEPLTSGLEKIKNLKMRVESIAVRGPKALEHWRRPANHERFFPGGIPEGAKAQAKYTRQILKDFTSRAYRRPVDDYTLDRLVQLASDVMSGDGYTFEMGVAQAMVAVLASPRFLFREEETLPAKSENEHPLIDEYSLASRLSYFLWSTMPDDQLFKLAKAGQLRKNLDAQVDRMMKSKKSDAFIENFAGQWLHARDIESVNISRIDVHLRDNPNPEFREAKKIYDAVREIPDEQRTPEEKETYTRTRAIMMKLYRSDLPELKPRQQRAMRKETELYFEHVIRENRSLTELLDSDYTFLNDALAEHYGIEGIEGDEMRRVTLAPDSPRGGVLTQGTILAYTSNPTRTSPVKRGVFILENILGTPPAAPPPNIPSLEDISGEDLEELSLRETLALHREKPICASCHNRMDPLGLALENFNALGIWRESELSQDIDPSGMLVTGEKFSDIREMKRILATERKNDFYYCFTEKLLTYALGRGLEYYDTETVDRLVRELKENDGRPQSLLTAIVHSVPFQKNRNPQTQDH